MSPSTFRQHFRALTGVSPLQYQKQLRLQEARQLMLNENLDAGGAGGRVGYESPSQFSREYSRLFGAPPQRDVTRMRLAPGSGPAGRGTRRAVASSTESGTTLRRQSTRRSLVSSG
jgi:AraC-like DNA-binding protein